MIRIQILADAKKNYLTVEEGSKILCDMLKKMHNEVDGYTIALSEYHRILRQYITQGDPNPYPTNEDVGIVTPPISASELTSQDKNAPHNMAIHAVLSTFVLAETCYLEIINRNINILCNDDQNPVLNMT